MTLFPRFAEPWMLLLLLLVPWSIYLGARMRSLSSFRKWFAITLRTLILLGLILALARTEVVKRHDRLAVFFLLDHSDSIPESSKSAEAAWVRNACEQHMTDKDAAGVIVFGENASVELKVDKSLGLREVRSQVGGEQTDLAAAVRLAMAAFPQGYMRRIVLLTDGNETQGVALEEVKLARADGIAVDTLPIDVEREQEVRVKEVTSPGQTNADEPFQLRIVVNARQACPATLRVYQRTGGNRHLLKPQDVQLQKGDNVFLLPQELRSPGFYEYEVVVEAEADSIAMNNTGRTFTRISGEPRVLLLASVADEGTPLATGLREEGIEVEQLHPAGFSSSPARLQNYDAVVLSNVSATELSPDQLSLLEVAVRDHGIGLVMVGGPDSFGAGGYLDTPVERALPVDMDIKQRKVLPRGALVTILHTCEFPNGNAWARDIAIAALDVLASQDLMGCLGYMMGGDSWIFPLQPVGDKAHLRTRISQGAQRIGDMPGMQPTLKMAYDALAAEDVDAAVKRVLVISDGDPGGPTSLLINAYVKAGIAISTVCINPHSASDQGMLQNIAQATGGQYYYVNDPRKLPQIFMKEAAVVKRGVMIEEDFVPATFHDSEILYGLLDEPLPVLHGYVVTTPKENVTIPLVSHEQDPLLSQWRYGLGKAVAFTSDASARWAEAWMQWPDFNRFWAQTVRWAMREITPADFRVETSVRDGQGYVRIDAVDSEGNFVNFLRPRGVVTSPGYDKVDLDIAQTGPGIYEGVFPVSDSGVYMVNLTYNREDGSPGMIPTGLALDYSREYEYSNTNVALLEDLAATGDGAVLGAEDSPFVHDLEASPTVTPVWPWLAAFSVCVLPFEIFVRRVVVPFGALYAFLLGLLRRLPGLAPFIPKPKERRTVATGVYRAAEAVEHDYGTAEEGADLFGEARAPAPEAEPGVQGDEVSETEATKKGASDYTRKLLEAKQRAIQSKREK